MADKCNQTVNNFKDVSVDEGKYLSPPFDKGDCWEKGGAILDFLKRILPKGTKVCNAEGCDVTQACLPKLLSIEVPRGKGAFHRRNLDKDSCAYYLHRKR